MIVMGYDLRGDGEHPAASHSFGAALRAARIRAGLTQLELGRRAGISVRAVRDIELGRARPRRETVRRLAGVVGLGSEATDQRLELEVLGPLRLSAGDRNLALGPLKQRCLLALLALQPGTAVGYQEITGVLWGADAPKSARNLIHTYVARLRRILAANLPEPAAAQVLVNVDGCYRLTAEHIGLDLVRFDELADRAGSAGGGSALTLLEEALACWKGPLLADLTNRLQQHPAAVAVRNRRLAALISYARLALDLGAYERAAERLRPAAAEEPLHEGVHALLMLALAGCGRQAEALRVFGRIRRTLVEDLGVEPGPLLREAQARVLQSDLPQPVRGGPVFSIERPPGEVPAFTGRRSRLGLLDRLSREKAPVVVISGAPGMGKTALAVHWAERAADRFPDGRLHVNLRGHGAAPPLTPVEAVTTALRALGVSAARIPPEPEEAAALYRSVLSGRRMLILLDDARDPEQVRPLLPGLPGCMVLVTCRDQRAGQVAVRGAGALPLGPLTPDKSLSLLARLADRDGIDRGGAARRLVRECGGSPLALRLTAGFLALGQGLPVRSRLAGSQRTDPLKSGDPSAAVELAFDRCHRSLPDGARRLLRLLGLMPGPEFRGAAAAALAGISIDEAEDLLTLLADAHLVDVRGAGWYGLHDLVHLYARERAYREDARDERDAALRRLLDHLYAGQFLTP